MMIYKHAITVFQLLGHSDYALKVRPRGLHMVLQVLHLLLRTV